MSAKKSQRQYAASEPLRSIGDGERVTSFLYNLVVGS
jgi:hypothetical protein